MAALPWRPTMETVVRLTVMSRRLCIARLELAKLDQRLDPSTHRQYTTPIQASGNANRINGRETTAQILPLRPLNQIFTPQFHVWARAPGQASHAGDWVPSERPWRGPRPRVTSRSEKHAVGAYLASWGGCRLCNATSHCCLAFCLVSSAAR